MLTDKLSSLKKRVACKCYPFFVTSILFFPFSSSFATETLPREIQEVRIIAQSGAVSLALKSIDAQQQTLDIKNNLASWLEWERERLSIYQTGQRWQLLHQRVATYEDGLPDNFYFWAKQQQVDALLVLKKDNKPDIFCSA